jgi:hypothetical protein
MRFKRFKVLRWSKPHGWRYCFDVLEFHGPRRWQLRR